MNNKLQNILRILNSFSLSANLSQICFDVFTPNIALTNKHGTIYFYGNNDILQYRNGLEEIYRNSKCISDFFSFKKFEHDLNEVIVLKCIENSQWTEKDWNAFENKFLTIEKQVFTIYHEVYGAICESVSGYVKLGKFTIFNTQIDNPLSRDFDEIAKFDGTPLCLISVDVESKEALHATNQAKVEFEKFTYLVNFMIGDSSGKKCVTVNFEKRYDAEHWFINNQKEIRLISQTNYGLISDLADPYFNSEENGNSRIWELNSKNHSSSKLHNRLLNSIEWAGKAIMEEDKNKSFIQFLFAIESLLHQNSSGLINASIAHSISENLAFLIGNDYVSKIKVKETFKSIYQKRSALVHGSSIPISDKELNEAFWLTKNLIYTFLIKEPFCKFQSMDELVLYVEKLKFS